MCTITVKGVYFEIKNSVFSFYITDHLMRDSNGAMTNGAMTNGAMTNGAMTNGAMTNGAMTNGAITS